MRYDMRRYSYDEILSILKKHEGKSFCFTDADRERILSDPEMMEQLSTLRKYADIIGSEPIPTLTFSAFSRFELDGDRSEYEALYFRHRHLLAGRAPAGAHHYHRTSCSLQYRCAFLFHIYERVRSKMIEGRKSAPHTGDYFSRKSM